MDATDVGGGIASPRGADRGTARSEEPELQRDAEPQLADENVRDPHDRRAGSAPATPYRRSRDQTVVERSRKVRAAIRDELAADEVAEEAELEDEEEGEGEGEPRVEPEHAIIALEEISLAFDANPILENVSFDAQKGETVVVVGESGTGKSTILKLILRLLVPDRGRVLIDGQCINDLSFEEALKVRQKMGMVFQGAALFDSMTVFENIAYPLREHTDLNDEEIEARVREKLQFVDLDPDQVMEQLPSELSGGMKKRVGIARGMANNPQVMLYDEPTSGLDPLTTGTITRLIMKLQRELDVTSIVVSHDIRASFKMASRIALLAERKVCFFGTPEEMAASDDKYIQDFLGGF
jgi:phospholipid/cholesterol/gamma-HCH transport system ATP-binding protein